MKSLFTAALVLGALAVSVILPSYEIKIIERSASACDPVTGSGCD